MAHSPKSTTTVLRGVHERASNKKGHRKAAAAAAAKIDPNSHPHPEAKASEFQ